MEYSVQSNPCVGFAKFPVVGLLGVDLCTVCVCVCGSKIFEKVFNFLIYEKECNF